MGADRANAASAGIVLLALLGACSPAARQATPTPVVFASATFTPIPTLTPAPTVAPPTLLTATPVADATGGTFYAVVSADNVNLRTKPGTVFPVSRLLAKGTRLQVLGHAPGAEWLYVRTDSNIYGWVLYWLVNGGHEAGATPLVQPDGVQVVRGMILDRAGVPVSGIGFAVTQGNGAAAARTDASTDRTGQFYAFLPAAATGTWTVSYVSVACTSNTMDAQCHCVGACGNADPQSVTISLPGEPVLQFVWR